jgi:hypothetical protein
LDRKRKGEIKTMKYFVFRKRIGYNHSMFWEYCKEFEGMTKEELEKNYAALEDCFIIEGITKYITPTKAELI